MFETLHTYAPSNLLPLSRTERDYLTGFSPRIILMRNIIMATTRRMWMNQLIVYPVTIPISHKTMRTVAMVVSIYFNIR